MSFPQFPGHTKHVVGVPQRSVVDRTYVHGNRLRIVAGATDRPTVAEIVAVDGHVVGAVVIGVWARGQEGKREGVKWRRKEEEEEEREKKGRRKGKEREKKGRRKGQERKNNTRTEKEQKKQKKKNTANNHMSQRTKQPQPPPPSPYQANTSR